MAAQAALVSLVVPVRDGERYLRESLDSVLRQTYSPLEVVLMDDASTDGTARVAASYGDRIRYHRQERARGIYANANDGIALAEGEFVAVYHADDVYEPQIVEREVTFLRDNPEVGAVFAMDVFMDASGREIGRLALPPQLEPDRPLHYGTVLDTLCRRKNVFLRCPTAMVRASVHRELGVYRQDLFKNTSDLDMWLRIARRHPIAIVGEYLMRYRRGHGSSSERYHNLRTEPERFFVIMDKYLADGGRELVSAEALAAYETHRDEDQVKLAVSAYALGRRTEALEAVSGLRARRIASSPHERRNRIVALLWIMRVLARLPRVAPAAALLRRRVFGSLSLGDQGLAARS